MTILRIIKLLDQKQTFIFLLFFLLSIISMLLETISIGLLIHVYFDNNFRCESIRFLKLYNFLEFNKKSKEEILFSIAIIILIIQTIKSIFLTYYSFLEQKFLTTIRAEISNKLFKIYLNKPIDYYLNNNSSQFIRNIQDSDVIRMLLRNIIQLIKELILFLGLSLFVIIFEPTGSGLVVVGLIMIGYIFTKYINKKAKIWGKIRQRKLCFQLRLIMKLLN